MPTVFHGSGQPFRRSAAEPRQHPLIIIIYDFSDASAFVLHKGKQIFHRHMKHLRDLHRQLQGWIVFSVFQMNDGLPPRAHQLGQLALLETGPLPVFLDLGHQQTSDPLCVHGAEQDLPKHGHHNEDAHEQIADDLGRDREPQNGGQKAKKERQRSPRSFGWKRNNLPSRSAPSTNNKPRCRRPARPARSAVPAKSLFSL